LGHVTVTAPERAAFWSRVSAASATTGLSVDAWSKEP
jgi:hypothetical protein